MVECHASDLIARVRFPLPAPFIKKYNVNSEFNMDIFILAKVMEMNEKKKNDLFLKYYIISIIFLKKSTKKEKNKQKKLL